jgi:hypothetical protein
MVWSGQRPKGIDEEGEARFESGKFSENARTNGAVQRRQAERIRF